MRNYYVYILASLNDQVLYIGVTNDLERRVFEHKEGGVKGFTQKYNCKKLVYFEETDEISAAIEREKQLKNWHREWKENLIREKNPDFEDLAFDWFDVDPETSSG